MNIVRVAQNAEGGLTARSNPNAFRRSKGDKHLQYLQFLGAVHHKPGVAPSRWEGSHTKIKTNNLSVVGVGSPYNGQPRPKICR